MPQILDSPLTTHHSAVGLPACSICFDTGVWMNPHGLMVECPQQPIVRHAPPSPAGAVFRRAALNLARRSGPVNAKCFDLGRYLTSWTSERPCERDHLLDKHFSYANSRLRNLHSTVEELRRVWLLPVGSRKDAPSGYWIITELEDFAEWVERSKSAPITQLTTIHRVARANFPVFAEQFELDFWNNIQVTELPEEGGEASVVTSGVT